MPAGCMMWPIGEDVASVGEWAPNKPDNMVVHHGLGGE